MEKILFNSCIHNDLVDAYGVITNKLLFAFVLRYSLPLQLHLQQRVRSLQFTQRFIN